jgi:cell wall-associated NlpC family hydrolase
VPTYTPLPTHTPYPEQPTYTPLPTHTALPTATATSTFVVTVEPGNPTPKTATPTATATATPTVWPTPPAPPTEVAINGTVVPIDTSGNVQTAPCVTAAMAALTKQGAPYVWGAKGPNAFDCSGLTWWSYHQAGINIGGSTYDQVYSGIRINCGMGDLRARPVRCWAPGDLIFLQYTGGQHVAIYVGVHDGAPMFMDCYNESTGCILHDVALDSFYGAHFWQARRIVSGCESMTVDPGQPVFTNPPTGGGGDVGGPVPGLEQVPDLIGGVSFVVPDPTPYWPIEPEPARPGAGSFAGWTLYPFLWVGWYVRDAIRELVWLLFCLAQYLANFMAIGVNTLVYALNQLWALGVTIWLNARAALLAIVAALQLVYSAILGYGGALGTIVALLQALWDLLLAVGALVGQFVALVLDLFLALANLLGWIGGLFLGLILAILAQLGIDSVPAELGGTDVVYELVHRCVAADLSAVYPGYDLL